MESDEQFVGLELFYNFLGWDCLTIRGVRAMAWELLNNLWGWNR